MRDLFEQVKELLPEGWSIEDYDQTGQPNGSGTVEPTWYRDWFDKEDSTHDRKEITIYGPWVERAK